MVEHQLRARGIDDERVLEAMARVPRELFVSSELRAHAYADDALPIGHDQTISQPYMVARICAELALHGNEKVLDVGTGSGYQAAVLAELAGEVHSIERIPELADRARAALEAAGYAGRVHVHVGDGTKGLPERAPFAAIAVAAAAPELPATLYEQLEPQGPARRPDRRPPAADARGDRPHASRAPPSSAPSRAASCRCSEQRGLRSIRSVRHHGAMGSSAAASLQLPVRLRGIQLGRPTDLLLDTDDWHAVGFVVRCGDESTRFLPYAACQPGADEIAVASSLMLLEDVAFYEKRGVSFRSLLDGEVVGGGVLQDVIARRRAASSRSSRSSTTGTRQRIPAAGAVRSADESPPRRKYPRAVDAPARRNRAHAALRMRHNWVQLGKFCAVGAVGYLVNLAVYAALLHAGVHYLLAATCSFLVAVTSNYIWNRLWTFRDRRAATSPRRGCASSSSRSRRSARTFSCSTS